MFAALSSSGSLNGWRFMHILKSPQKLTALQTELVFLKVFEMSFICHLTSYHYAQSLSDFMIYGKDPQIYI